LAELLDHFRNLLVVTLVAKDRSWPPDNIGVELPETELEVCSRHNRQRYCISDESLLADALTRLRCGTANCGHALSRKRILCQIAVLSHQSAPKR